MRYARLLLLMAFAAAGCGDGTGPGEPPSGHYELATLNGAALPIRLPTAAGVTVLITAGALDFLEGNVVRHSLTVSTSASGSTQPTLSTETQDLTYRVSGSKLVFPQPKLSGSYDNRSVTLRDEGTPRLTSRFVKP